jgi:sugar lactone lactonase YvrE
MHTLLRGLGLPEGPRWHDGRLWFSDMHAREVVSVDPSGADRRTEAVVDHQPSGLGWLPDGRLLAVSMTDRRVLRREADGRLVEHADLAALAPFHCNDAVVDGHGRMYVGNFGFDLMAGGPRRTTTLVRVDPDGAARVVADDLAFPNGTVITPDGRTLVLAESTAQCLTAFDVAEDGTLSNRRVWARLPRGTSPDGICLDAAGLIWSACPRTGRVLRLAEGGQVVEKRRVAEGDGAYACTLGSTTLYVCAAPSMQSGAGGAARRGSIVAFAVDVGSGGSP